MADETGNTGRPGGSGPVPPPPPSRPAPPPPQRRQPPPPAARPTPPAPGTPRRGASTRAVPSPPQRPAAPPAPAVEDPQWDDTPAPIGGEVEDTGLNLSGTHGAAGTSATKKSRKERRAEKKAAKAESAATRPEGGFPERTDLLNKVPVPGKEYRNTKRVGVGGRVAVIGVVGLALLSSCGVATYRAVSDTRLAASRDTLTAQDVQSQFYLDDFPTQSASVFAGSYLSLCLSRYADANDSYNNKDEQRRQDAVASMSVASSDASCGGSVDSSGSDGTKRRVVATTYTGQSSPVEGVKNARYVVMQVLTDDGVMANYSVPVWFQDVKTAQGPRVIGQIGAVPLSRMGSGAQVPKRQEDSKMSDFLLTQFAPQFVKAWYASDDNLSQFLTSNATPAARTGLQGLFTNVKVDEVTAYPGKGSTGKDGEQPTYKDGSTLEADVTVTATSAASKITSQQSYRIILTQTNGHWFVTDVRSGVVGAVNQDGGKAATQPGIKPSPSPSPSSSKKPSSPPSSSSQPSPSSSKK